LKENIQEGFTMRKRFLLVILVLVVLVPGSVMAGTTITGAYGFFTVPTTKTPLRGEINVNAGYIFDPGNFYVGVNTAIIPNWELSAGKEFVLDSSSDEDLTPYILGTKYRFYSEGRNDFEASVGLQVELLKDEAGVDGTPVSFYLAISDYAGKLGYMNTGLGYTLGVDAGYLINFFFGLETPIIGDSLYAIGEFTNYSPRLGQDLAWDLSRGVFNAGLVLNIEDFLDLKLVGYDMLDDFLTVGLGAEVGFKAF
jgi:hypothetical protein